MSKPSRGTSTDAILDAALELIAHYGYEGMSMAHLSDQSGLPASSIYYHFGSKHGVLAAVLERGFKSLHDYLPDIADFTGEPFERFERWFTKLCQLLTNQPNFLRLLITVCVERRDDDSQVQAAVARIREHSRDRWVKALSPIFAPNKTPEELTLVDSLAMLGRAVADGATVAESFDGTTHLEHATPFLASLRALADARSSVSH